MAESHSTVPNAPAPDPTRRDFLVLATTGVAVVGAALTAWPFLDSMNPAADTLALASIEFDLTHIAVGQRVTIAWRGKPVFVDHRTAAEITAAEKVDVATLPDPEADAERVKKKDWLIVVGVCTHLGCIPLGQKATDPRGEFGGWFCPCHGSQYDTAGRIRKGPAPRNLDVPPYKFTSEHTVQIG